MNVHNYKLVSDQVSYQEVAKIVACLEVVLQQGRIGDVVEFGCYTGTTSLFLQRLLQGTTKQLHVYDSFAGLPPKTDLDHSPAGEQFKTGELQATKKQLIHNFRQANLPLPIIHKGWFNQLTTSDVPEAICFAFLDGDYYQSITDSLRLIWTSLTAGSIVIVDDYQAEALPGAQRAVDAWLKDHPVAQFQVAHSLAILYL